MLTRRTTAVILGPLVLALGFVWLVVTTCHADQPSVQSRTPGDTPSAVILRPQPFKLHVVDEPIVLRAAPQTAGDVRSIVAAKSSTAESVSDARPRLNTRVIPAPAGAHPGIIELPEHVVSSPLSPPPKARRMRVQRQQPPMIAGATVMQPAIQSDGHDSMVASPSQIRPAVVQRAIALEDPASLPSIQQAVIQQVAGTQNIKSSRSKTVHQRSGSRQPKTPTVATQPRVTTIPHVVQRPTPQSVLPRQSPRQRQPSVRQVVDDDPAHMRFTDKVTVPFEAIPAPENASLEGDKKNKELVTLVCNGAELTGVLRIIADYHKLNLVVARDVEGPVTVSLHGARLDEVLDAILGVAGFAWHRVDNLLYVTGAPTPGMDPRVQGRTLQVYALDYVSAVDVEAVASNLLSPVGTAHIAEAKSDDQLRTREMLIVEDTLAGHRRIAQYIAQVDVPPRQVLIEAHVLQIALGEEERHGINLRALARVQGARLALEGSGFASEPSGNPGLALKLDGTDMNMLVELIRQNTNSRTLASPKVSVVNHQEAKIQIGQRLPYSVATTTQTSTVQNVQFLEVGIVLTVRPMITEDGNVLMSVLPKVSGGKITDNGFPEEDTTEVQTTVLMPDGGGIVIGGLIREDSANARAVVPGLSKVPVVGRLFRRKTDEVRRNELVVALVTHVLPDVNHQRGQELKELNCTIPKYSRPEIRQPMLPGSHGGHSEHFYQIVK